MGERVPIQRVDADGTVTEGTAELAGSSVHDFRDLNGEPMMLPPGASFVVPITPEMAMGDRRN